LLSNYVEASRLLTGAVTVTITTKINILSSLMLRFCSFLPKKIEENRYHWHLLPEFYFLDHFFKIVLSPRVEKTMKTFGSPATRERNNCVVGIYFTQIRTLTVQI
jgi:hypothetical protein